MKPRLAPAALLAGMGLAGAVAATTARQLSDFDLPWHLAMGRLVLAARSLRPADTLSYTAAGTPVRGEWLADVLFHLADRTAGPAGIHLLVGAALAALAALLVRAARPSPFAVACATSALALWAAGPWLIARPVLLGLVALAALVATVEHHRRGGGARALLLLPLLQLLFANLHGLAFLGGPLALGYGLYTLACRLARGRLGALLPANEGRDVTLALVAGVLAFAATGASSFGLELYLLPLRARDHDRYITEWVHLSAEIALVLDPAIALLVALCAAALGRRPRPSLWEAALVVGSLALALLRARLVVVYAVLAAPVVARRLAPLLDGRRLAGALSTVASLASVVGLLGGPGTRPGFGWDPQHHSEALVRYLRGAVPLGPIWNFLPFGGWLAYRLGPRADGAAPLLPVFIDGRTGWVYPARLLDAYARAEHAPAAFAALQQEYGLRSAVVRAAPGETFAEPLVLDPAWRMVFLDEVAAVYVRPEGDAHLGALAQAGYRTLRHLSPIALLYARPPASVADLAHDGALAVAQAPDSPRAHLVAAAAARWQGDRAALLREREAVARLVPDHPALPLLDGLLHGATTGDPARQPASP